MALFANHSDTSTEREKPHGVVLAQQNSSCGDEAESGPMRCQLKYLIREESIFVLFGKASIKIPKNNPRVTTTLPPMHNDKDTFTPKGSKGLRND